MCRDSIVSLTQTTTTLLIVDSRMGNKRKAVDMKVVKTKKKPKHLPSEKVQDPEPEEQIQEVSESEEVCRIGGVFQFPKRP